MTKRLIVWLGLPVAVVSGAAAMYSILDYLSIRPVLSREITPIVEQVAANTEWRKAELYTRLTMQHEQIGLSVEQWRVWCQLGKEIGALARNAACPPRRPLPHERRGQ